MAAGTLDGRLVEERRRVFELAGEAAVRPLLELEPEVGLRDVPVDGRLLHLQAGQPELGRGGVLEHEEDLEERVV